MNVTLGNKTIPSTLQPSNNAYLNVLIDVKVYFKSQLIYSYIYNGFPHFLTYTLQYLRLHTYPTTNNQ